MLQPAERAHASHGRRRTPLCVLFLEFDFPLCSGRYDNYSSGNDEDTPPDMRQQNLFGRKLMFPISYSIIKVLGESITEDRGYVFEQLGLKMSSIKPSLD